MPAYHINIKSAAGITQQVDIDYNEALVEAGGISAQQLTKELFKQGVNFPGHPREFLIRVGTEYYADTGVISLGKLRQYSNSDYAMRIMHASDLEEDYKAVHGGADLPAELASTRDMMMRQIEREEQEQAARNEARKGAGPRSPALFSAASSVPPGPGVKPSESATGPDGEDPKHQSAPGV